MGECKNEKLPQLLVKIEIARLVRDSFMVIRIQRSFTLYTVLLYLLYMLSHS